MARAIWSGSISFGMVSIPVKLYGATESKDIAFHLLHKTCGTRVKQVRWCPTDDVEVPWSETVRGYEYAKDQYVTLTEEDFEQLPLPSKHTIDLDVPAVVPDSIASSVADGRDSLAIKRILKAVTGRKADPAAP